MRIEDKSKGFLLRSCDHCLHKGCLEDMFRLKKTECLICKTVIAPGFAKALNVLKVKAVKKKKANNDEEVK